MDLRQLKYFLATAETGQVSRAANALAISQSSVTAAVRRLEDELGTLLFHRRAGGMDLTEAGQELLTSARDILERLEQARHLKHRQRELSGRIRVAATYTVIGYFLPFHLDRLAQLAPSLTIELTELPRESIEEGLLADRFDIAVLLTSNMSNPRLVTETLLRSQRRLWVSANHRFRHAARVPFAEIAEEDYVMLTVDEAAQTSMRYWSVTGHTPKIRLRTASTEAVRSMVANGQGVTILSDMVYRPWSLEGKRIVTVPMLGDVPTMDVGLAWREGAAITPAIEQFRECLRRGS